MSAIGPGDLVVCVDSSSPIGRRGRLTDADIRACRAFLVNGRSYRVSAYIPVGLLRLVGDPWPDHVPGGYGIRRFRKLNDGTDDAELIERIRKCKPIREPANA